MRPATILIFLLASFVFAGCIGGGDSVQLPANAAQAESRIEEYGINVCCIYGAHTDPLVMDWGGYQHGSMLDLYHEENVTGWVLELSWSSGIPLENQLALRILYGDKSIAESIEGVSPLRLALPHDIDNPKQPKWIEVKPWGDPTGVAYHVQIDLQIAIFMDTPVDPDYQFI